MEISVSVTDTFLSPNCTFSDLRMNYPAVKNADTFIKNNKNMCPSSVPMISLTLVSLVGMCVRTPRYGCGQL